MSRLCLALAFSLLLASCSAVPSGPWSPTQTDAGTQPGATARTESVTQILAGNDSEKTMLRYRGDGWWDEVSTEDGSVRFSFRETARTPTLIEMTDETRNGGLSLRIDLEREAVFLSEGAGRPYYRRYTITETR